jgi:superfamily II DNA helicase RecQ
LIASATRKIQVFVQSREVAQFEATCQETYCSDHVHYRLLYARGDALIDDVASPIKNVAIHLSACAYRVFGVNSLHPRQVENTTKITFGEDFRGRLLVGERTGGGKSLILQPVEICLGAIMLVIVPLLSLAANQLALLAMASQACRLVKANHLT